MPVQMPDILAVNTINILPTQELVELNKLQMNNLSETTQDTNPNLNIRSSKLIRSSMETWARLVADATMTLQRKVLRVWNPWSTRFLLWKTIVVFILQIRVVAVNRIHLVLPWGSIVLPRQRVIIHRPSMLQVFQYLLYQRQGLRLRPQLPRQESARILTISLVCQVPQILPTLLLQMTVQIFRHLRVLLPALKHLLTSLSAPSCTIIVAMQVGLVIPILRRLRLRLCRKRMQPMLA